MRLWKKKPVAEQPNFQPEPSGPPGGPVLPGSAGYRGVERMKKGGLPQSRFTFVRPDAKKDE